MSPRETDILAGPGKSWSGEDKSRLRDLKEEKTNAPKSLDSSVLMKPKWERKTVATKPDKVSKII